MQRCATANLPVSPGGRGMIYNAAVADLIRMLSLVKTYAEKGVCSTGVSGNDESMNPGTTESVRFPAEAGTTSAVVPQPECPA